jgi:putative redox protein
VALAGCMAMDVAVVLRRSRTEPQALSVRVLAERAQIDPKRLTRVTLQFAVAGDVAADRMERALALSREKYCSVWHSLRPDIELVTGFDIAPAAAKA